jgi:4-hydroxy-3-methylbut-2-en-1-yl diphosphate reductase
VIVDIDEHSGFCFGVVKAINMAEKIIEKEEHLYCLGDIVHNWKEVDRLNKKGLIGIDHDKFNTLSNEKVLLRAHGEPPETYTTAKKNNIELFDATCPVVIKLQKKIKNAWEQYSPEGGQIVIYGKKGHAEVNGLVGQTAGNAIVVEKTDDLQQLNFHYPIILFSQTTKTIAGYNDIIKTIQKRIADRKLFIYYDTICRQVANRLPKLKLFISNYELVIFVSGKKSSNGKMLFEFCSREHQNAHKISSKEEVDKAWFSGIESVGICGATSTPQWLMEEIADYIQQKFTNTT